jgi:hypothetical protein
VFVTVSVTASVTAPVTAPVIVLVLARGIWGGRAIALCAPAVTSS